MIKRRTARHKPEEYAKWLDVMEETRANKTTAAKIFADARGLSRGVFEWLIDQGLIGFYHPRRRTKEGEIWVDFEWAFPICAYHPPAFYGMHLKWFARDGRSGWRYEPRGCLAVPLVVGDLPEADLVIVGESTWDTIAAIDLYKMHNWSEADGRRATIATRGPANLNTCPSSRSS